MMLMIVLISSRSIQMQSSIREHRDNCGGIFRSYAIIKVSKS